MTLTIIASRHVEREANRPLVQEALTWPGPGAVAVRRLMFSVSRGAILRTRYPFRAGRPRPVS